MTKYEIITAMTIVILLLIVIACFNDNIRLCYQLETKQPKFENHKD